MNGSFNVRDSSIQSRASVRDALDKIDNVIELLRASECDEWVRFLSQKLTDMGEWYDTKEALFQIGEVCHAKALGDLQVRELSWNQWIETIVELKSACAKAFNELETTGPLP